ncbi:unnamed protein product [Polarella glacialis]|uniref:Helicase C-terminal domain-containing protein n=1 Tax=Polarella glacialis TaxID=89957 RepID=A0A813IJ43_POLGL|nr:unnamed protein product [Polarella glacialis]
MVQNLGLRRRGALRPWLPWLLLLLSLAWRSWPLNLPAASVAGRQPLTVQRSLRRNSGLVSCRRLSWAALPRLQGLTTARAAETSDAFDREARRTEVFSQAMAGLAREVLADVVGLPQWRRLEWAAALHLGAVPVGELPPWALEQQSISRRDVGVDLLTLDGKLAVQCKHRQKGTVATKMVQRFITQAVEVYNASRLVLVVSRTSSLAAAAARLLQEVGAEVVVLSDSQLASASSCGEGDQQPPTEIESIPVVNEKGLPRLPPEQPHPQLRQCQVDCLEACAQGARVIEMACGTGKTRVMRELADRCLREARGRVLVLVPSRVLLMQLSEIFPEFCPATEMWAQGTGHNDRIDWASPGYVAVYDSAHLLSNITSADLHVDEAHHPLPEGCPEAGKVFRFSATHAGQVDFRYSLDRGIEDGVLCDYDITIPIVGLLTHLSDLAMMLRNGAGRYRRVLAYCNTVAEAKRFQRRAESCGLPAWHINGDSPEHERQHVLSEFSGPLKGAVHVLVTVQVLGEGVNVRNADTCIFVEPRSSYVAILQAMGRVLRTHPAKPLSHLILPAVTSSDYLQVPDNVKLGVVQLHPADGPRPEPRTSSAMNATHQPDTLHDKTISTITEEPHGTTPDGKLSDCAPNAKRFQFSSFSDAKSADSKKYLGRKLIPASVTGSRISSDKACDWGNSGGARELRAGSSGATGSTRGESSFRTAVDADAHGSKGEDAASKDATSERCRNGTVALWEDRNQAWNYPQLATTDGEALMPAQSIYLLRQAVNRLNVIASTAERQKLSLPSVLVEPKRRRVRSGFQLRSAESAVGSQLSRFLQVLATADSRIAESLLKGEPGGRFRFVDARRLQDNTLQPQDTLHTISKCWDELSAMAHAHFAWLARLTQLNEFCEATGLEILQTRNFRLCDAGFTDSVIAALDSTVDKFNT